MKCLLRLIIISLMICFCSVGYSKSISSNHKVVKVNKRSKVINKRSYNKKIVKCKSKRSYNKKIVKCKSKSYNKKVLRCKKTVKSKKVYKKKVSKKSTRRIVHVRNEHDSSVKEAVRVSSKKYGVDKKIIYGIIRTESNFNRHAKNGSSVGYMQVLLRYHKKKFKGKNPYDTHANIDVGTSIYKDCKDRFKNDRRALRCYNGGGDPHYVSKVTRHMKNY